MSNILEFTYFNAKKMAEALESVGYRPFQTLNISGLQPGTLAGDRETFHVEGTSIIVPRNPTSIIDNFGGNWNEDLEFDISLNSPGADNDDWTYFDTTRTPDFPYQDRIDKAVFYKFTVRNHMSIAVPANNPIKLYVLQDPNFIVQLNKLIKDIIT